MWKQVFLLVCFHLIVQKTAAIMTPPSELSLLDPSSYSRPDMALITELFLNLTVDFDKRIMSGNVDLTVEKVNEDVQEIILDAKEINIKQIIDNSTQEDLKYSTDDPDDQFGSKLTVTLPKSSSKSLVLRIIYETSPNASGLQWLTPDQTAGKIYPYVFSQFQPIHARSVIPCQDTPGVKLKYRATIRAASNLTVLMSAIPTTTELLGDEKVSHFVQQVPIPSYLIAIAVGALESRRLGPRSRVWAEKEIIEAGAYEFADTEHQLKTAEEICGPYVWGIYDLLVLPPSFPFGGMENPCLTFITPTLLAGDRSLANVVAHEIAHSWTGNLITNRNFEHFWLNEGFTMFVERKIIGRLTSPQDQDFEAIGGLSELNETINLLGVDNPLTDLVVNLTNVHPDDAFSIVPYEKGYTFLRYLEDTVGGPEQFEPFMRKYFETFKYKSMVTDDFKQLFENYFANNSAIKSIDWNTWRFSPGMPPIIPKYDQTRAETCNKILRQFLDWETESGEFPIKEEEIRNLTTDQRIYFLQQIIDSAPQSVQKLRALDDVFGFGETGNAEIKYRWIRIGLRSHWEDTIKVALEFINQVGRMKYVRPIYRDLYAWDKSRDETLENYKENKKYMMHVVAYTLAKDLHVENGE